jgi:hypothetical protein
MKWDNAAASSFVLMACLSNHATLMIDISIDTDVWIPEFPFICVSPVSDRPFKKKKRTKKREIEAVLLLWYLINKCME